MGTLLAFMYLAGHVTQFLLILHALTFIGDVMRKATKKKATDLFCFNT